MKPIPAHGWMEQRLVAPGPKRVLAIDGGGVSPVVAAGLLAPVEQRLARLAGRPDFRLCDYFDLIGGVSFGAVVAAGLAMGAAAGELAEFCGKLASEAFAPDPPTLRAPRFDVRKIDAFLERTLGGVEMGGEALRTGLAIFAKNSETGALWAITNNPRSRYWDGASGAPANKSIPLRRAIQASLAAPTAFDDIAIPLGPGDAPLARFIDAANFGLSNPSLHLLLLATLRGYGLEWHTGPDRILMLSVGAGAWPGTLLGKGQEVDRLGQALANANYDASQLAIAVLQGVGATARPWRINSELGDMRGATLSPVPGLHFQRMEALLTPEVLKAAGVAISEPDLAALRAAGGADPAALAKLHEIGKRVGQLYFSPAADGRKRRWDRAMFPRRFDPAHFKGAPPGPPRFKLEALGRAWDEKG